MPYKDIPNLDDSGRNTSPKYFVMNISIFRSTTHDKCIYYAMYEGHTVLMLCQVDGFLISCKLKSVAKQIYNYIGNKLQLHKELFAPFKYLGPATDYNGVDINQTKHYIEITIREIQ